MKKHSQHAFSYRPFLQSITSDPGVYQMFNAAGDILYVGKARNLKKRLSSYFQKTLSEQRIKTLVSQIADIEVIVTRNETEALLLECQLIQKHMPRYNILLRDDKSYPYIVLSGHHYPRLFSKRGERNAGKDHYFGPYPSVNAVRETLQLMQKTFKLRTCRDTFFRNRSRPCLLYQIKKCSGPCVHCISDEDYGRDVANAKLFLSGKNVDVTKKLVADMTQAAAVQHYELAAKIRDQITSLRHVQTEQVVSTGKGNADIFIVIKEQGLVAVQALYIQAGRLLGNKTFYLKMHNHFTTQEILSAFIPQYYLTHDVPEEIILSEKLEEQDWVLNMLVERRQKKVKLLTSPKGIRAKWLKMAYQTGMQAIHSKIAKESHYETRLKALQKLFGLSDIPKRMECFDISHSFGESTVASCVVFNETGAQRNAYRRFNIQHIQSGDDYAALYQAIKRRYEKIKSGHEIVPDILFIDGGKGQLHQAQKVLASLDIHHVFLVGVAKGLTRKPGLEKIYIVNQSSPLDVSADSPALHLIQQIRDEAHRFAIVGHRQQRAKTRKTSTLESIEGLGPKKRQALLQYLGGMQEIKKASVEELQKVPGISLKLAQLIYAACR